MPSTIARSKKTIHGPKSPTLIESRRERKRQTEREEERTQELHMSSDKYLGSCGSLKLGEMFKLGNTEVCSLEASGFTVTSE